MNEEKPETYQELEDAIQGDLNRDFPEGAVLTGWYVVAEAALPGGYRASCHYWSESSVWQRAGWLREAQLRSDQALATKIFDLDDEEE